MRRIRSKGTAAEMVVRRAVHSLGFRYRLHDKRLPGKPDLVFSGRRKVIFVHGCFWHQHQDGACRIVREPKSNQGYWVPKLDRNRERDVHHLAALKDADWTSLIVWECETKGAAAYLLDRLKLFLA